MKKPRSGQSGVIFRETQHPRQVWVWVMVTLITALLWWGLVQQVILRRPFGSHPASDQLVIAFFVLFGIGLPVFFYYVNLRTELKPDALYVRFFPFQWHYEKIELKNVAACRAREYNPIREYGGWGIRFTGRGKAYNVYGNYGVQLEMLDGRRLLIGSQHAAELAEAVNLARSREKMKPLK